LIFYINLNSQNLKPYTRWPIAGSENVSAICGDGTSSAKSIFHDGIDIYGNDTLPKNVYPAREGVFPFKFTVGKSKNYFF